MGTGNKAGTLAPTGHAWMEAHQVKLHVVVDPPSMKESLLPTDRAALRRAGVTMKQVRASYTLMVGDVLKRAFPEDAFTVEVRVHATGTPFVLATARGKRVSLHLTERMLLSFELAEIAWVSSVARVTMLFAVAAKRAPR